VVGCWVYTFGTTRKFVYTVGQKMVPMFFIFFIFLFFEIFSLAMISNASIKVESPGTQKHSRKGFTALSLFVVKYLLEMSRKVFGTIS